MTRKEIIDGLKFTVEMFLFDPNTGETFTEPRNDMDKTTIEACKGAIELLEQTDGDLISRTELLNTIWRKEYGKDYDGVNLLSIPNIDIIENMPSAEKTTLSAEKTTITDGDLISRQAVDTLVDELARAISDERCFISRGRSTATIMQDILDLPSVTPQPSAEKTAEWKKISPAGIYECTNCSQNVMTSDISAYKYCHGCGAKMREAEE